MPSKWHPEGQGLFSFWTDIVQRPQCFCVTFSWDNWAVELVDEEYPLSASPRDLLTKQLNYVDHTHSSHKSLENEQKLTLQLDTFSPEMSSAKWFTLWKPPTKKSNTKEILRDFTSQYSFFFIVIRFENCKKITVLTHFPPQNVFS